jgi:hypothetical protein
VGRLSLYMWLCGAPISLHVVVWGAYLFTCGCVGRLSHYMWLCGAPVSLYVVVWGAYLFICGCVGRLSPYMRCLFPKVTKSFSTTFKKNEYICSKPLEVN